MTMMQALMQVWEVMTAIRGRNVRTPDWVRQGRKGERAGALGRAVLR